MATKIILLALGILGCTALLGQQFFYNTYGDSGYDTASDVIQMASDSSYYLVGSSSSASEAPSQVCLLHVDQFGDYLASYFYGGENSDIGVRVLHKPGDGFWLAGYSNSFSQNADFDFYLIKLNENYELQWQQTYGTLDWERLRDAILLPDDGVLLVGDVEGLNTQGKDAFMVRTDSNGEILWQQTYAGAQDDIIYSCSMFDANSFVIGGIYGLIEANAWLARFDLDGNVIWSRNDYFSDRISVVRQVRVSSSNIFFYGGWTPLPFEEDNYRPFQGACFLDNTVDNIVYENGVRDQNVTFCVTQSNVIFSVFEVFNTALVNNNGPRAAILRFTSTGYFYDFSHEVHGIKVKPERIISTLDNAVILVGSISDPVFSTGGGNAFILKIDETVFSLETINQNQIVAMDDFLISGFSIFPNPAQEIVSIVLPNEVYANQFSVIDSQGRLVIEGTFTEQINLTNLSPGIYVLQLHTNSGIRSMRIQKL